MTPEEMQNALVADLTALFEGEIFFTLDGERRPLGVYPQDLPVVAGWDADDRQEESREPYLIVRVEEGEIQNPDSPQTVDVILVICTCNPDPSRQGHRDVLHIVHKIMQRFTTCPVVNPVDSGEKGSAFTVLHPLRWAAQNEDTHPYYFGAVSLKLEVPSWHQESPFT